MESYSTTHKNKVIAFAEKLVELENIILNQKLQNQILTIFFL